MVAFVIFQCLNKMFLRQLASNIMQNISTSLTELFILLYSLLLILEDYSVVHNTRAPFNWPVVTTTNAKQVNIKGVFQLSVESNFAFTLVLLYYAL